MSETFKAAVLLSANEPLAIRSLQFPEIQNGQVLIKNIVSGICRSQLMEATGQRGPDKWLPHLLGHEAVGIVESIGPAVSKVEIGDKVIISWIVGNGESSSSPRFVTEDGEIINSGAATTFNEYSVVPENRVFKAPVGFSDDFLPQFGCALLTGGGMVISTLKEFPVTTKARVLIIGFGGVGIASALVAKSFKNLDLFIVEKSLERRELASKLGFTKTFESTSSLLSSIGEDDLFDYCFESAGTIESIESGFASITNAGILTFASHPENGKRISIDPYELIKGKIIRGTWGGNLSPDFAIPEIGRRLLGLDVDLSLLVGPRYALENVNDGLSFLEAAGAGKPVVYFGESK